MLGRRETVFRRHLAYLEVFRQIMLRQPYTPVQDEGMWREAGSPLERIEESHVRKPRFARDFFRAVFGHRI